MDPLTALTALGPLAVDLGKAAISRWVAPDTYRPGNIDEWVRMRDSDLALFKAMSDAGGMEPSYPWVAAIKQLMRPAVALLVLGVWATMHLFAASLHLTPDAVAAADNFAGCIGFYMFGDRSLFYARQTRAPGRP